MNAMASQITSLTIVYSTVYSGADQRKHQSSVSLAFVRGIPRWPVNSPHKGPVTRKMFPFDDVIMICRRYPTPTRKYNPFYPYIDSVCRNTFGYTLAVKRLKHYPSWCWDWNLSGKKVNTIAVDLYSDVIMGAMAFQITSLAIVYSTVYSGADQRKHQSSTSLAFVRGIHRWPVNSPHKWPVTLKMFPFDDVIMCLESLCRQETMMLTTLDKLPIRRRKLP